MVEYKIVGGGIKKSYANYLEKKQKFQIIMDTLAEGIGAVGCEILDDSETPVLIFATGKTPINGGVRWQEYAGIKGGFRPTNAAAHRGVRKLIRSGMALRPRFTIGGRDVSVIEREGGELFFKSEVDLSSVDGVESIIIKQSKKKREKNG